MREVYSNSTDLKTQAITVTLGQRKELVINIPGHPKVVYKEKNSYIATWRSEQKPV